MTDPSAKTIPTSDLADDLTGREILDRAAIAAADKKAIDLRLLDLRGVAGFTDYFLVGSGNTDRQVKAIHDAIHATLKDDLQLLPRRVEGLPEARWVLMDYVDVVVHLFVPETREFYRLEQLWGDVPVLELPAGAALSS
jgi:ribosome-associated protein